MDDHGNAIIVWQQSDGLNQQIFMSEYREGKWSRTRLTDHISPDGQDADHPRVAMDDDNNAIIVWEQYDGSVSQIFVSEYRKGAWTHPKNLADHISPNGKHAYSPEVAMDNNSNAIIVWRQHDGSTWQIFKSEYRSDTWTYPSSLADNISPNGSNADEARVAMDDSGNAIIVWQQSDGLREQIFKSEYRKGAWAHPSSLTDNISPDGESAFSPRVAMANNGNALIVWQQSDGSSDQIFKSEYRSQYHSSAWTHPSSLTDNISPDGLPAYYPQVAVANNGNAIIVWHEDDGSETCIFVSEYCWGI